MMTGLKTKLLAILLAGGMVCLPALASCDISSDKSDDSSDATVADTEKETDKATETSQDTTAEEVTEKDPDKITDETTGEFETDHKTPSSTQVIQFAPNGDGTCSVTGAYGYIDTGVVVIPSVSPEGDRVTAIGENAFI